MAHVRDIDINQHGVRRIYNEWLSAIGNVDNQKEIPNKKIISTAGWYDNKGLVCDGGRESSYIYSTEKYIKIHGERNVNCLVLAQRKDEEVNPLIGKKKIGYFFRHENDLLFEKEEIDCDMSFENKKIKPNKNIEDVWKRVSSTQLNGKYSKYNFDDLLFGEIWFDLNSMTHLIHFNIPKSGYVMVRHLIAFSYYAYKDSIDDQEHQERLYSIEDGIIAKAFETNGLRLDEENLESKWG